MTVRVVVGRLGKAHGIKGALSVEVRTDLPEVRFAAGAVLYTEPAAAGPLIVDQSRWHSGRLLVQFEGVNDRTQAEQLRGVLLSADIDETHTPEDPEEFFDRHLVGLTVRTVAGQDVGQVREVAHLPQQDLLVVLTPDDREVLVPFVSAIVPVVDRDAGYLLIDPPGGLLGEDTSGG